MSRVALCLDSESACQPALLGLADESLESQSWLSLYTSAEDARRKLQSDEEIDEVWISSTDDMESINLAAALKRDRKERNVLLLAGEETGSLLSRANAAGIDASLTPQAFAERYAQEKKRRSAHAVALSPSCASGLSGAVVLPSQKNLENMLPSKENPPAAPQQRAVCVRPVETVRTATARRAFLLPVVSGSGGAGKSSVAALAAVLAKRLGYSTLLLDFDLQFGDMREMLGDDSALAVDELLEVPTRAAHIAGEGEKPALLAAPRRLEACDAVMGQAPYLLDCLAPQFDVIIANTGAFWVDLHALLLERASKVLFLVDQRTSSLRACKHAVDLCARCGIATNPFVFAVNRCAKGASFSSLDVSCAMQGARAVELRDGGRDVEDLLAAGLPLDLIAERNDLCASIEQVLIDLLPHPPVLGEVHIAEVPTSAKGLFGRRKARRRRSVA